MTHIPTFPHSLAGRLKPVSLPRPCARVSHRAAQERDANSSGVGVMAAPTVTGASAPLESPTDPLFLACRRLVLLQDIRRARKQHGATAHLWQRLRDVTAGCL